MESACLPYKTAGSAVCDLSFFYFGCPDRNGIYWCFLYQSYGRAAKEMMLNDTRQLVNQVEINLNNYLRSMMRISDAMYYNVIKK